MPPASPVTVRRDQPTVDELDTRRTAPDEPLDAGEVGNWGIYGTVVDQTIVAGRVHTTVEPRTDGGRAALESAVKHSPRHTLIVGVTETT